MVIDCITIFPEMFAPMKQSIMGRAQAKGLLEFNTVYLRDFAINDYGQVDDVPYGGEPGMVLRPEPLAAAIRSTGVKQDGGKVIYLTADGVPFTHKIAEELSHESHLVLVCGHYKGIDDRIRQTEVDMEISIGDFVVSGGELPAMLVTDAVVRLIDGALGNRESGEEFEGKKVPEVLLSGHHKNISEWRKQKSLERTQERRPDILEKIKLNAKFGDK